MEEVPAVAMVPVLPDPPDAEFRCREEAVVVDGVGETER